ncbi:hypothetical protein MA16_Dca003991 [Dendrobium catenatum]|uniref:Uncharacterized protein n=1 Tax=Dendrobium catenatum TaxID=906689 RepID=A0A2I0X232_9ASPA|nr:hypothetical protein MA16_Dca003991 [Dendrobium catenatum]
MGKDAIGINSILLQAIQPFVARLRDIVALPQRDFSTVCSDMKAIKQSKPCTYVKPAGQKSVKQS